MNSFSLRQWSITVLLLIGLPLCGVALNGQNIRAYLQFPPLTRSIDPAGFSPAVFALFVVLNLLMVLALGFLIKKAYLKTRPVAGYHHRRLPAWGWLGLLIMAGGWVLAWTRLGWFEYFQHHTFVIPWIGYILAVNGLCLKRSGSSLLTDAPARFGVLFLVSAGFWWFFEYLNRFVQNWHYVHVAEFGPLTYTVLASLAFSTVLPAVLSTYRLLLTYQTFGMGLKGLHRLELPCPRFSAATMLVIAASGLALLGIFPDYLYALIWCAPLLIISSLQHLSGQRSIFSPLAAGDWRAVAGPAVAALVCGFFWEMWNIGSLARWEYTVPFVNRYQIFAMPIVGYGGYLPFGLECLVIGRMVFDDHLLNVD